jgi:hypothetical protein
MASRAQLDLEVELKGADKASKGLGGVSKEAGVLGKAMNALKGGVGGVGGGLSAMLGPIGLVSAGVGVLGGALLGAAKAAAEEQVGIDRLNNSLKNSVPGWDGNTQAVEKYIAKQEKLAFADDVLRDSLNLLVTQTGDLTEAQNLQATAMDLARFGNIDLEKATRLVLKADDESYAALGKLGIQVDKNATKEEALAKIRAAAAGQADSYANSTAGAMERTQNAIGNAIETIGGHVMTALDGPLQALADFLQSDQFNAFAEGAVAFLGNAFKTMGDVAKWVLDNVITPIWNFFSNAEVQTNLQNIANTIAGALVGAFNGLRDAAGWVFDNIIKPIWDYFSRPEVQDAVMGIANAIGATLTEAWNLVSGAATLAWNNVLKPIFDWFGQADVQQKIGEIATAVGTTLRDAWNFVKDAAKLAWDNVLKPIWDFFASEGVSKTVGTIATAIGTTLKDAFNFVKDAAKLAWDNVLKPIWDFFASDTVSGVIGGIATAIGTTLAAAFDGLKKAASAAWDMIVTVWEWLTGQAVTDASTAATGVVGVIDTELIGGLVRLQTEAKTEADIIGGNINEGMAAAIRATRGTPLLEAVTMVGGAMQAASKEAGGSGATSKMYPVGANMGQGMAEGIGSKLGAVVAKAKAIVQAGIDAAKAVSDQRSPSKVYHIMGENDFQGYIEGADSKTEAVMATTANVVTMGMNAADRAVGDYYHIMGEGHGGDYEGGWVASAPALYETISNIQSTAAQRLANLPEDDIAAIKAGGGLITDTLSQAILDTWPPLGEQILARFDETWGTAIERAQALMAYLNNLNLYGSATGGPGASYTDFQPPPSGGSNSGRPVVPMAEGGDWMVTKPTLFLAHPGERATFVPAGKQGPMGAVNVYIGTVVTPDPAAFADGLSAELQRTQRLRTAAGAKVYG